MPPVTQDQAKNMSLKDLSVAMSDVRPSGANNDPQPLNDLGPQPVKKPSERAREYLAKRGVEPTVSASQLTQSVQPVTVPEPQQMTEISPSVNAGIRSTFLDVQRTAQGARELQQRQQELADLGAISSLDLSRQLEQEYGFTPDRLSELDRLEREMEAFEGEAAERKQRRLTAAGDTAAGARAAISREDVELAVRSARTAAQAEILRGNLDLARERAKDAVDLSLKDRQFNATNLLNQINSLQGQVDSETEAALADQKFQVEQELATIAEVKEGVDAAIASGAASQADIATLTDPNVSDAEKLALAQGIVGRGATEERDLDLAVRQAQLQSAQLSAAKSAEQLKKLRNPAEATRSTQIIDVNGTKQLVDTQSGEVITTFGPEDSTDDLVIARETAFTNSIESLKNHNGLNSSVGPVGLARIAITDAFGAKDEFIGSVENVVKGLTLNTFAEAKEQGLTFGAMSEGEWRILAESATKIGNWRQTDDQGNVTGYDVSEAAFKRELDTLSNFAKMDALRKGANPDEIGVKIMDDGSYWTLNSDGTFTQLSVTQ